MFPRPALFLFHWPDRLSGTFCISLLVDLDSIPFCLMHLFANEYRPYSMGYIDFGVALPLVIGAFIGSGFGVKMHDKINTRIIKIIFGVLLLLVAARMAVEFANGG